MVTAAGGCAAGTARSNRREKGTKAGTGDGATHLIHASMSRMKPAHIPWILSGIAFAAAGGALVKAAGQETAAAAYKNIQVFRDLPRSELMPAMFFMRASLGVTCTHCHVDFVHFERDDKKEKQIARQMILMVRDINDHNFQGRNQVTCNTCHRGQVRPLAPLGFAPTDVAASAAPALPSTSPTVDELFRRYLEGTGAATAPVTSVTADGTRTSSEGWSTPVERSWKAPSKGVSSFQLSGSTWRTGFDGTSGWNQDNHGVHPLTASAAALFRVEAALLDPASVRTLYSDFSTPAAEELGGRAAYVVDATLLGQIRQRLFFDAATGLLRRITTETGSPFGPLPEAFDLEDYRKVGALTLPFAISHLKPDFSYLDRFEAIRTNLSIDDKQFQAPKG